MRTIPGIQLAVMVSALGASACFTLVNLDPYRVDETPPDAGGSDTGGTPGPDASSSGGTESGPMTGSSDLTLAFLNMTPHLTELFEYRVIDSANFIQSRGFIVPMGAPDVQISVPMAVPPVNGPYRLDFYGDHNNSGGYDGSLNSPLCPMSSCSVLTNDHAWRINPLDSSNTSGRVAVTGNVIKVTFTHDTSFTDINTVPNDPSLAQKPAGDTGQAATIEIQNADAYAGKLMQVRIFNNDDKRTVGLYRIPKLNPSGDGGMTLGAFKMTIPGCVETGTSYTAFLFIDANDNQHYDDPSTGGGDLGFTVSMAADATGLDVVFNVSLTDKGNQAVGSPWLLTP